MKELKRITFDPNVMGGKPCIRGTACNRGNHGRTGYTHNQILKAYPYLEEEDIQEALTYAAWRSEEIDVPLVST